MTPPLNDGVIFGIPVAIVGFWLWRKGVRNLAVVDTAYTQYVSGINLALAMSRPVAVTT